MFKDRFLGHSPLRASSAQVISSSVTNVSEADIVCLLFNETFGVISEITHHEQHLSSTQAVVDIHAVGCGVHGTLTGHQISERIVVPECGYYAGYTCLLTLGLLCPWTAYSPLTDTCPVA